MLEQTEVLHRVNQADLIWRSHGTSFRHPVFQQWSHKIKQRTPQVMLDRTMARHRKSQAKVFLQVASRLPCSTVWQMMECESNVARVVGEMQYAGNVKKARENGQSGVTNLQVM